MCENLDCIGIEVGDVETEVLLNSAVLLAGIVVIECEVVPAYRAHQLFGPLWKIRMLFMKVVNARIECLAEFLFCVASADHAAEELVPDALYGIAFGRVRWKVEDRNAVALQTPPQLQL